METTLPEYLKDLDDPRIVNRCRHNLVDILVISLCAVICGADDYTDIEEFGKCNEEWFSQFLPLSNGIPSHDTFTSVFSLLDTSYFSEKFVSWTLEYLQKNLSNLVAIDGKELRGSDSPTNNKNAVHMVSAFLVENGIVLGQVKTDEKSNEITAIPKLLDIIDVWDVRLLLPSKL